MGSTEMSRALATMQECWPQPFRRSPVEDGRNLVFLGPRLAVHLVRGVDAEISRADSELTKLDEALAE